MAKMTKKQIEYLLPVLHNIESNILVLSGRIDNRRPWEWQDSEFSIVASIGEELSKSAQFIRTTLLTLRDVENGELER